MTVMSSGDASAVFLNTGKTLPDIRRSFIKGIGALLGSLLLLSLPKDASATDYNWYHINGKAKDIGAQGGQVWVIGNDPTPNGDYVFRLTGDPHNQAANPWTKMDGSGVRIAVDNNGLAWVVNAQGDIYRAKGDQWNSGFSHVNGKAKDIGAGGGKIWVIGYAPAPPYGDALFLLTGDPDNQAANPWTTMGGGGTNIAVDDKGNPWVVNASGDIFSAETSDARGMVCAGVSGCRQVAPITPGAPPNMICGCQ